MPLLKEENNAKCAVDVESATASRDDGIYATPIKMGTSTDEQSPSKVTRGTPQNDENENGRYRLSTPEEVTPSRSSEGGATASKDGLPSLEEIEEHLRDSDIESLEALCNSGGMCDPFFDSINTAYNIRPGEWWICFSNKGGRQTAKKRVLDMLRKEIDSEGGPVKESQGADGRAAESHQDAIPPGVLEFWSRLRRYQRHLYSCHYKTLQQLCTTGGSWDDFFKEMSQILGITADQWDDCYSAGVGCREKMAANIIEMFDTVMSDIPRDVFNAAGRMLLSDKHITPIAKEDAR